MGEFEFIAWLRERMPTSDPALVLGIGDDAAVIEPPAGRHLVASTDTLNQDVHFAAADDPVGIGHKALAVNLSDLAAMGARPRWVLLNLSLPEMDADWLAGFVDGFAALARAHDVALVGGDTCRGPLAITVTALGELEPGRALTRAGARPGDRLVVSGWPGLAGSALLARRRRHAASAAAAVALDRPEPRLALGRALAGRASACLDVSDGLLADLGHLAAASGCGAELELARLPVHPELLALDEPLRWDVQLAGGDDYELLFSIPAGQLDSLRAEGWGDALPLTEIGVVCQGGGVRCIAPDGSLYAPARTGWDHFHG